jgi:hypothetical protein
MRYTYAHALGPLGVIPVWTSQRAALLYLMRLFMFIAGRAGDRTAGPRGQFRFRIPQTRDVPSLHSRSTYQRTWCFFMSFLLRFHGCFSARGVQKHRGSFVSSFFGRQDFVAEAGASIKPVGPRNFLSGLKLSGERDGGLGLARLSAVCPLGGHMYANGFL